MPKTLVLTIHGPFAYVVDHPGDGLITLMAPMCPQHKGGISTIGHEFLFEGNHCSSATGPSEFNYTIEIPSTAPGQFKPGVGRFLSVPKAGMKFEPKEWRFWITVRSPDFYVAVNPAEVIVDQGTGTPLKDKFAVGVRFIYTSWAGGDVTVKTPSGTVQTFSLANFSEPDHGDMEIEYAGAVRDDPDHEDAVHCFDCLMQGLKLGWKISFPLMHPLVSIRNDCKAAVAWVANPPARDDHAVKRSSRSRAASKLRKRG